jgi:5'-methylthioadenosine phosphorylase
MATTLACIVGEGIQRLWLAGKLAGDTLGPRKTPFGASGEVFLVKSESRPFYLLARYGTGMGKTAASRINHRANVYALKDLGARFVLGWGTGGAIVHNIAIGQIVILQDLIDRTCLRARTFFEDSPLGYLRQFPVFCPVLRSAARDVLHGLNLPHFDGKTAAVCEGPRWETPAEIRMLAASGAELVTHAFAPEVFLARELQLCYAAICRVVNYAETGSAYRPFAPGQLFGEPAHEEAQAPATAVGAFGPVVAGIAEALEKSASCQCPQAMAQNIAAHGLEENWRKWFKVPTDRPAAPTRRASNARATTGRARHKRSGPQPWR